MNIIHVKEVKEESSITRPSRIFTSSNNINGIESRHLNKHLNNNEELLPSLEEENTLHEEKAEKRFETFRSIILNESIRFSWIKLIVLTFGIIIIAFSTTIPFSLIPANDFVLSPDYWYEIIFHGLVVTAVATAFHLFGVGSGVNLQYLQSTRVIASVHLVKIIYGLLFLVTTYFVWTQILFYNYPIPFLGQALTLSFYIIDPLTIWFICPMHWRKNENFGERFSFYFHYCIFFIIMANVIWYINTLIKSSSDQFQPIVALLLPLLREAFERISIIIVERSAAGDVEKARIFVQYSIATRHTVNLCIMVGQVATFTTSCVLIAVDFSVNIYFCLRIIWLKKRRPNMIRQQIQYLQDLSLYELVEFHAPLAYFLVFCVAYYGPNGRLFGNILNDYWTFSAVDDIVHTMTNVAVFFIVDFSSTVICAILLWQICDIKLWKVFLNMQEEFGKAFASTLGFYVTLVIRTSFII